MTEASTLQSFEALTASYPESKGSWDVQGCVHCNLIFKKIPSSSARTIQTYVFCDKYQHSAFQQGLVIHAKLYKSILKTRIGPSLPVKKSIVHKNFL